MDNSFRWTGTRRTERGPSVEYIVLHFFVSEGDRELNLGGFLVGISWGSFGIGIRRTVFLFFFYIDTHGIIGKISGQGIQIFVSNPEKLFLCHLFSKWVWYGASLRPFFHRYFQKSNKTHTHKKGIYRITLFFLFF